MRSRYSCSLFVYVVHAYLHWDLFDHNLLDCMSQRPFGKFSTIHQHEKPKDGNPRDRQTQRLRISHKNDPREAERYKTAMNEQQAN